MNTSEYLKHNSTQWWLRRQNKAAALATNCSIELKKSIAKSINMTIDSNETTSRHSQHCLNAVLDTESRKLLEYCHLLKTKHKEIWSSACSKEFAQLCQGRAQDDTPFTNTIFFIAPHELPPGKRPTYLRICADFRLQEKDPYRIRFTVGGNLIEYNGATYTLTAVLTTAKLLFNSVIPDPGSQFFGLDVSNFYLETKFTSKDQYKYMFIPTWAIPQDIMEQYNLREKISNGQVLAEVRTGIYGLPQAGQLA